MTKYNANKCVCGHGHKHDSRKEARRCDELHLLQRAGEISDLLTQVRYELIPAAKYQGMPSERRCDYIADFVYLEGGKRIVEDAKGVKTREYIVKRKLFKQLYCSSSDVIFRET